MSIGEGLAFRANRFISMWLYEGRPVFAHRTTGGDITTREARSPSPLTPCVFHHLVGVREFGNLVDGVKLYVDGVLVASSADNAAVWDLTSTGPYNAPGPWVATRPFAIGRLNMATADFYGPPGVSSPLARNLQ